MPSPSKVANRLRSGGRCLAAVAALLFPGAHAAIIYVDVNNDSGVEDGSAANPYDTIQEGIDAGVPGDRVLVAPGRYKETILMADGVSVLGSGSFTTIIDGSYLDNSVVTFDGTRFSPVLADVTITGGRGDQRADVGGVPVFAGGGVLLLDSSAVITRTVITGNVLDQGYCLGGGVYVSAVSATPQIIDSVIADNVALSTTVPDDGDGGGLYVVSKSGGLVLQGNRFLRNRSTRGGAIHVQNLLDGTAVIERNVIRDNEARDGGGIFSQDSTGSVTTIRNSLIAGNDAVGVGARGGGVLASADGTGGFTIANNTFVANRALDGSGGALWLDDALSSAANLVANGIVAGNGAALGGGIDHTSFHGEIRSNLLHDNAGGDLYDGGGSGVLLADNLFADPGFATPDGPYQLAPSSPAVDSGDDALAPAEDLHAFARPFDGDGDAAAASDRGAYEYPSGEVLGLDLLAGGETIAWQVTAQQEGFHLYRGSLERLRTTGEFTQDAAEEPLAARFCGLLPADEPWTDAEIPPAGGSFFYLVSLAMSGWEGGLGDTSAGFARRNAHPCP